MEDLILIGYELILIGYELLTVLIPAFITIRIFCLLYKKRDVEIIGWHTLWLFVFAIYIFGVFHFTGAGTIYNIKQYGMEFNTGRLNLIPFSDTNIDYIGYGLNVVLFVPLGFLLPLLCSNFSQIKYVCSAGIILSLLVEISQLLNIRSTDIDDLILNTVGAMLGFIMFRLYLCITKPTEISMDYSKCKIFIYMFIMFLGHFFFYNELGMAKLLFGF